MKKRNKPKLIPPLKPAPYVAPVSIEPLYTMAAALEAIIHLAQTREPFAVRAAIRLNRQVVSHNTCLKVLMDIERQIEAKPPNP